MSAKNCNCCGAEVDIVNGGCALLMAFCRKHTTTLTNIALCRDCYEALIDEDLRKLNVNAGLGIVFDDDNG